MKTRLPRLIRPCFGSLRAFTSAPMPPIPRHQAHAAKAIQTVVNDPHFQQTFYHRIGQITFEPTTQLPFIGRDHAFIGYNCCIEATVILQELLKNKGIDTDTCFLARHPNAPGHQVLLYKKQLVIEPTWRQYICPMPQTDRQRTAICAYLNTAPLIFVGTATALDLRINKARNKLREVLPKDHPWIIDNAQVAQLAHVFKQKAHAPMPEKPHDIADHLPRPS
jgi:hypothetical protein